jgi:hypothetical protein
MNDTPRTDERLLTVAQRIVPTVLDEMVRADFARQLERELNAATADLDAWLAWAMKCHDGHTLRFVARPGQSEVATIDRMEELDRLVALGKRRKL